MSSSYETMRDGLTAISSVLKYDTEIDEQGVIYKDCGDYLQMIVPMRMAGKGSKDHNTYDVYVDGYGRIVKVESHSSNSGPTGQIYPRR